MPNRSTSALVQVSVFGGLLALLVACQTAAAPTEDPLAEDAVFHQDNHSLLPPDKGDQKWRNSVGVTPQPVDEQPIAFNHGLHTKPVADGGLAMDCQYCHSSARKSKHGGVPATEVCMNCHKLINDADRPELQKLKGYWERGEAIPWVKVHDTPDFVHFNHSRHVQGGVQCTECHADMTQETVAVRAPTMTMTMGWCLECHESHPSVDTNYGVESELRRAELKDCYTCHQ